MSGMSTSQTMRSGAASVRRLSASLPDEALDTSMPCAASARSTTFRTATLESTTMTLAISGSLVGRAARGQRGAVPGRHDSLVDLGGNGEQQLLDALTDGPGALH